MLIDQPKQKVSTLQTCIPLMWRGMMGGGNVLLCRAQLYQNKIMCTKFYQSPIDSLRLTRYFWHRHCRL